MLLVISDLEVMFGEIPHASTQLRTFEDWKKKQPSGIKDFVKLKVETRSKKQWA